MPAACAVGTLLGIAQEEDGRQGSFACHGTRLRHELKGQKPHRTLWTFYQELLSLRKMVPALVRHRSRSSFALYGRV
ncbi:MAG TPA: hypothetical protein VEL76_00010 [Gemmataceae bacterium]|nr:hypothetical protein [Gemmataceae bacterium]